MQFYAPRDMRNVKIVGTAAFGLGVCMDGPEFLARSGSARCWGREPGRHVWQIQLYEGAVSVVAEVLAD